MSKRIPIFLGFLLIGLAVYLIFTPTRYLLIERLENMGYDSILRTRILSQMVEPKTPIVIIDIDDKTLAQEGRWPWPRDKLAELTDKLKEQGASVIAFDMFFPEKAENITETVLETLSEKKGLNPVITKELTQKKALFDEDEIFAKSLSETDSVIGMGFLPRTDQVNQLPTSLRTLSRSEIQEFDIYSAAGYIGNNPTIQKAAKSVGFINIFADNDGIIRRAPLLMEYGGNIYPSLALITVMQYLGENNVELVTHSYGITQKLEGIKLGSITIPTDNKAQVLIPFVGKSYTFKFYSAIDILENRIPKEALLGKIVLIGASATGFGDQQATAIQNPFPGVEIQATLVNGILENNFSYRPAWTSGTNFLLTLTLGLLAAFLFPYLGPKTLGAFIILALPVSLFIVNWVWTTTGFVLSLFMPIILMVFIALLNIVYGYIFETRRRERLKDMFGQYVPQKHIDEMLKTKSDYGLRGEDREMSVLFADIRDFTGISEGMSASDLVEMLNTFFTPMTEVIFKHRGTIDKYVGDLIMAFWGAPLKDKLHARHALQSALEMQAKLKMLNPILAKRNWPEIRIGIGINSGLMSVGDMGSRFRRNYTVLGDAVNLASRIEGLTKFYDVEIIVTESTRLNQTRFVFRKLDRVRVKGKTTPIELYELVCLQSEITDELKEELELYHKTLDFYFAQSWELAENGIQELRIKYPDKKIYQIYQERITAYKSQSLPEDWDGVYAHLTK